MTPKPMVLVTIYPDGWVETRATDDVRVKIHTVPILRGTALAVDAEHGITAAALERAYHGLPRQWQQLVDETDVRGVQTGLPNTLPEEERYERAKSWAVLDAFTARVKSDDRLRLDLYQVSIPTWIRDHADDVRLGRVAKLWKETYHDERDGV